MRTGRGSFPDASARRTWLRLTLSAAARLAASSASVRAGVPDRRVSGGIGRHLTRQLPGAFEEDPFDRLGVEEQDFAGLQVRDSSGLGLVPEPVRRHPELPGHRADW